MPVVMPNTIFATALLALSNAMTAISLSVLPKPHLGIDGVSDLDFDQYVEAFDREYRLDADEYSKRRSIFMRNMQLVQAQNTMQQRLWTAGTNHLTDRTEEELAQLRGWKRTGGSHSSKHMSLVGKRSETLPELPETLDWTHLPMARKVPDQGSCGSCWAVATAAMLHGSFQAQMNDTSRSFSAQQLVSCTPNELDCGGTGGCDGATVELAMEYIERKGLQDESQMAYRGRDLKCPPEHSMKTSNSAKPQIFLATRGVENADVAREQFGLQRWQKLPENKARPVYEALLGGPLAVSVAASDWYLYSHGVFNGCGRNAVIDHAVVLFGYGKQEETGKGYWKLRNSWGSGWGEKGFIRLLRHDTVQEDEDYCGIDNNPKDGTACKPYPDQVPVCGMCGLFYDTVAVTFGKI